MAVSLDIANAFNTLPWKVIRGALEFHQVPAYIKEVLGDYLRDRTVYYIGRGSALHRRATNRGVPQGSVFGPLLWNLGYNWILQAANPHDLDLVCYADDTLVMARGRDWEKATRFAEVEVALVVGRVRTIGLTVALQKTESIWFAGPRRRGPV